MIAATELGSIQYRGADEAQVGVTQFFCFLRWAVHIRLPPVPDVKRVSVTVWKPLRYTAFLCRTQESGNCEPVDIEKMHVEVFSWHAGSADDVFASSNANFESKLRTQILEKFAAHHSVENRGLLLFVKTIQELREEATQIPSWSDTTQQTQSEGVSMRADLPNAFLHQLEWIGTTFENVPGASISIR